ncbi:MAG: thiamine ABC transporter substrate binding subunit [Devosiaceae bacterium]|nr:thiamine ABC transporter substrate binding subunit [Devosiaceae bacterium]
MLLRAFFITLLSSLLFASISVAGSDTSQKPVLTIYTYDAFAAEWGPAPLLKSGFEKQCDCTINFVAADSSIGALRKVQLEGTTTKADIVLGLDTSLVGQANALDLFAPHNVDVSALNVPNDWASDNFIPFDYGYLAMIYNKELLPDPPGSFTELAANPSDLKIVIQDPRSSTPGLGLVLWMQAAYGEKSADLWAEIAPSVITMTRGWSEAYALFLDGEADMVLSYTTSPAYHKIVESDDRFAAALFEEGQYTQIEVAGILQSSPNKQLAQDFLKYLISPEAQKIIPTTNWMYPVANIELPPKFAQLPIPQTKLLLDDEQVNESSSTWIAQMLAAFQ